MHSHLRSAHACERTCISHASAEDERLYLKRVLSAAAKGRWSKPSPPALGSIDSPSAMPHGSTDAKASLKNVDPERCSLSTSRSLGGVTTPTAARPR